MRRMKCSTIFWVCAAVASMAMAAGCATERVLYDMTSQYRKLKCPTYGAYGFIPIPGRSGVEVRCAGAGDAFDSPGMIRLDGLREGIPVSYVCKAGTHTKATAKKGCASFFAALQPEVDTCVLCEGDDRRVVEQRVVGFRIAIHQLVSTECDK